MPTDIDNAVVELLDNNGIKTTAEFGQFDNTQKARNSSPPLTKEVMLKFFKITKESAGEDKEYSSMTTEGFKNNFEKAFFEVISGKGNWFERVDGSRDPEN